MALPSDEMGADSRLAVTFYKRSMKQEDESLAAGVGKTLHGMTQSYR